jgi:3-mercaptopyruvate sulfurtransferase SseA
MTKAVSLISIIIILVFVTGVPSWSKETPSWWPQAMKEAQKGGYELTTPGETQALYESGDDFLILDVRPDYEFNKGHLPKAGNFEVDLGDRLNMKPEKKALFEKVLGPDKDRLIVVYCRSFR